MSIESVMLSNHLILCRPCLLPPSIFSSIRVFSNESALHIRRPKYWSSSFSIRSSNEYSELYFLSDWLVWSPCSPGDSQGSSSTPQFKGINSSVRSLLYGPTVTSIHDYWKNHSFNYTDFVSKVISLLFNMLSKFVIDFLPRYKCLLISSSGYITNSFCCTFETNTIL